MSVKSALPKHEKKLLQRRRERARRAARKRRRDHARTAPHQSHPFRLYRVGRLAELLDVNASTIWRWRQSGVLPPPVEIGGIHGWTEQQIAELMQRREGALAGGDDA